MTFDDPHVHEDRWIFDTDGQLALAKRCCQGLEPIAREVRYTLVDEPEPVCSGSDACYCEDCEVCDLCERVYRRCACERLISRRWTELGAEHRSSLRFAPGEPFTLGDSEREFLYGEALISQLLSDEMSLDDYRWQWLADGSTPAATEWAVEQMIHRLNEMRISGEA